MSTLYELGDMLGSAPNQRNKKTIKCSDSLLLLQHQLLDSELKLLLRNFRQLSKVSVADERVVDDALASSFSDYEDALQYYSALTRNVDVIITRNTRDFVHATIPVLTPDEFLTKR